jgi:cytochrome c556
LPFDINKLIYTHYHRITKKSEKRKQPFPSTGEINTCNTRDEIFELKLTF